MCASGRTYPHSIFQRRWLQGGAASPGVGKTFHGDCTRMWQGAQHRLLFQCSGGSIGHRSPQYGFGGSPSADSRPCAAAHCRVVYSQFLTFRPFSSISNTGGCHFIDNLIRTVTVFKLLSLTRPACSRTHPGGAPYSRRPQTHPRTSILGIFYIVCHCGP